MPAGFVLPPAQALAFVETRSLQCAARDRVCFTRLARLARIAQKFSP
jgi:hypothetical protein